MVCVIVFDLYLLWDWISQFSRGTNHIYKGKKKEIKIRHAS